MPSLCPRHTEDVTILGNAPWVLGSKLWSSDLGSSRRPRHGPLGWAWSGPGLLTYSGPTIAPQNRAVRILGRKEDFDIPGPAPRLIKSYPSSALAPFQLPKVRYWRFDVRNVSCIKFGRLYASHVQRTDDNPTVGMRLAFVGGKTCAALLSRV